MEVYHHGGDLLAGAVQKAYANGETDYYLEPLVRVDENGRPVGRIQEGNAVVFCCRRGEREIELTDAFVAAEFPHFKRTPPANLEFVILTMYHEKYAGRPIAFAPSTITGTLAETVSRSGMRQLHCAESEKYAHVTYFFNGGTNQPFRGEDDIKVPSPKGVPFDEVPALSLPQVADEIISGLRKGYELIVTNFANGDVIGHTSNREAKIECARHVDTQLGRLLDAAKAAGYVSVITADHGNIEELTTAEGKPHVAHTSNPVPLLIVDPAGGVTPLEQSGTLRDIAPTVLHILGIKAPEEMTGKSLIEAGYDFGEGRKALLIILDGWGIGPREEDNPIKIAQTPVWDALLASYPPVILGASGEAVGLQAGKPGNSEAGHINIGAGRVVKQDDVRLDEAMKDGSFEKNEVFLKTIELVRKRNTRLHLLFLLTRKSSHGSIDYPLAMLKMARGLPEIYLHVIFDGRSTPPGSAPELLLEFDRMIQETGTNCQIVDGVGRGLALDRDGDYAKIKRTYDALVSGIGRQYNFN